MSGLGDKRLRKALRDLDHARRMFRLSYVVAVVAAAFAGLVTWGWIAAISWGMEGMGQPGIDKTGTMIPFVFGLIIATCAAVVGLGFAGSVVIETYSDRRQALEDYEDLALEIAS